MVKILTKLFCLLIVVIAISCKTNTVETPRQLLAKEKQRLKEFLETVPKTDNPDKLNVKDLWTEQAIDTIDKSLESGLIFFERKVGSGETVSLGKEVGIRYFRYVIQRDSAGNVGMYDYASNYNEKDPDYYVIGDQGTNPPAGVREAVKLMSKNGRCRVVLPSTLLGDSRNFFTSIYDIEITYLSK